MNSHQPVDDRTILDKFVEDVCSIVEKHCKYIVVSGFVAIAHGRSRGTEDIDMIIERISASEFQKLHQDLREGGYECIQGDNVKSLYVDYLSENSSLRYVMEGTFVPELELKLAKDRLDEDQLANRTKLPLTGLDIYFSSIETNIAFKEELLKSDKDMEDSRHLRIIYSDQINEEEIDRIKGIIRAVKLK
jgi:hypothetical protein